MAGGGISGVSHGETDDFPTTLQRTPCTSGSNATMLHCQVLIERFTFRFQGLEQRLTGVEPQV